MSNQVKMPADIHSRSEFFYLAMAAFMSRQQNSILPEAMYFLSPDQLLTFLHTFGGSTVKVPSVQEFGQELMMVVAMFYRYSNDMTWQAIQSKLNMTDMKFAAMRRRIDEFEVFIKNDIGIHPEQILKS